MSNEIVPFSFEDQEIRVFKGEDGKPWFYANDVARALGYPTPKDAVSYHCKGAKNLRPYSEGGSQPPKVIPESDVYRLIMRSNKPEAEVFQDWVTEVVLPSIRQTGGYLYGQEELSDDQLLEKALAVANRRIEEREQQRLEERRGRLQAIKEKGEIAHSREASVMSKYGHEKTKREELQDRLAENEQWDTVKGIGWLRKYFVRNVPGLYVALGRHLSKLCRDQGIEPKEIPDVNYGSIKAYPVEIIEELKERLDDDPDLLSKYRR